MRITNKIMQRNNLSNINTNKVYQDKLSTQMSTQKKVNRLPMTRWYPSVPCVCAVMLRK